MNYPLGIAVGMAIGSESDYSPMFLVIGMIIVFIGIILFLIFRK